MRLFLLLPLFAVACQGDVTEGKPKAEVTAASTPAPAPAPAPTAAPAAGKMLQVDKARSKVHALGAKITAKHDLAFPDFTGEVGLDGENVSSLSFTVQVASLTTDPEKLQNHLKSPDFFDVEKFPTATFTSTEIKPDTSTPDSTHSVTGNLTLHGQTKQVTFPARINVGATEVNGRAEFSIDRKDFGIVYPGKPDDLIQDGVVLTIEMIAPRQG